MKDKIRVKAVIFDRDGTIVNSDLVVIESVRYGFKQLGFELSQDDIPHMIGRSVDVYKDYFLEKWDFDYDEFRRIQKAYFYDNLDNIQFFDDTVKLIKNLYSKGVPLAVTTSAGLDSTLQILKNAEIDSMFKVIVTREECEKLKPDPESYLLTVKKLGIEAKYCVAIEDTALGVEAAKNAGLNCIAIPNEYTKDQDFSKADFVAKSANEIYDLLEFI